MYDYFYEQNADNFSFYRIPKLLFTDKQFAVISTESRVLYGLLLDRVSLSRVNGWMDDEGRVYVIFTISAICEAMNCSNKSAVRYLAELETAGLIERVKQKLCKPDLIYVKNFSVVNNLHLRECNNYIHGSVKNTSPEVKNLHPNYTDNNHTNFNHTNLILSGDSDRMGYEAYLREKLGIDYLYQEYSYDREMLDGILELILDIVCSKKANIVIAGDEKSINLVKSRFMKLDMEHIRYVMNCMQENTTKIRSIKQYLLAALYNAPATIGSYYRAEVNHDMAEGKI